MELYPTLYLYFKLSMNQRVKMFLDHTIYCNNRKKQQQQKQIMEN